VDEAVEIMPALIGIVDDRRLDRVHADTPQPLVDAFEIMTLFAIKLGQRHDRLQRFVLGLDLAQNLRALDVEAGGAREVNFVARIRADDADILAGRLGAIPGTARNRHLDLGGGP